MRIPSWIEPYRPLVPMDHLVQEVNRIYHAFDAETYDSTHDEMRRVWPPLWEEMIAQLPGYDHWRVLDFGMGTGFAAEQVLRKLRDRIQFLAGYDPSPEMLEKARIRLAGSNVFFSCDLTAIAASGPYNLLITNSVLHHLPDIHITLASLVPHLQPGACWLLGNEPSARFYLNGDCRRLAEDYAAQLKRRKWFTPSSYMRRLRRLAGTDILSRTARAAVEARLFARRPSHEALDRLIDFHVAHSAGEVQQGRGFDLEKLKEQLAARWALRWSKSYSYLGSFSEVQAPREWRERAQGLQRRYPTDGANFAAVWEFCAKPRQ